MREPPQIYCVKLFSIFSKIATFLSTHKNFKYDTSMSEPDFVHDLISSHHGASFFFTIFPALIKDSA